MTYEVLFYEDEKGRCPTEQFLKLLPLKVRGKLAKWIEKLEEYGPDLPRPYADVVRGKIRELRLVFASDHYRFLYFFHGKKIIITHGFVKKTDRLPENEIKKAERFRIDFGERIKRGGIRL